MIRLRTELERLEFMIALTERANYKGSLLNQLNRLDIEFIEELTGLSYTEGETNEESMDESNFDEQLYDYDSLWR